MARWIEITGTSKADLKAKAQKVQDKLHSFLNPHYKAKRYAALGSSIRLHKTQLKVIIKMPDVSHAWWKKIKDRVSEVPHWVNPKKISNDDPNYFTKIEI